MRFKRILLKLSGESLMGEQGYGIDVKRLNEYAQQIKDVAGMGVQIGEHRKALLYMRRCGGALLRRRWVVKH